MRLAHFRLDRYGPFEQLDLPLDPTPGRVNLIVAPNGYGKSVVRHAIGEFLFGIEARTPMNFRFGTEKMRLSADIFHNTGRRSLIRRKGNGITLADITGREVPDHEATNLRGGADATTFRELFGLDTALLRSGGHDLIRSQGRLGQVLFAAGGGMARVRDLLTELERRRDDLGKATARHKSRPLWSALSSFEQSNADLRRAAMRPDRWHALEQQATEYRQHLHTLLAQQTEDAREHDRLRTIRACRPWLARLHSATQTLAEAQDAPDLDDGFEKRWRDALEQSVVSASNAQAAAQELDIARANRSALTYNPGWIAAQAEVAELDILRGRAEGAEVDLPKIDRELTLDRAKVVAVRRDLGWDPTLALPASPLVKDAQRRLHQYPKLEAEAAAAQEALTVANATLSATQAELDSLPPPGGGHALADLVDLLRAAGDPAVRLDTARRRLRDAQSALCAALDAIPDSRLREEALATTAPPSETRLEAAGIALNRAETAHDQTVRTQAERGVEIERQQAALLALEQAAMLRAPDALPQARAQRDALWSQFCTRSGDPVTAIVLDRAIRHADAVADALIAHGQEVAQAAALRRQLSSLQSAQATHAETVAETHATLLQARSDLLAMARAAGGHAEDLPALRSFLRARGVAAQARLARDTAAAALRDLEADLQILNTRLSQALAAPPCDLVELGALLAEADRRIDTDRNLAAKRSSLGEQVGKERARQAGAQAAADKAEQALQAWRSAWHSVAANLARPAGEAPLMAADAVAQIETMRTAETAIAEKQLRIDDMHAAIASLAARVTALSQLAPHLTPLPPIEAAHAIGQRMQAELREAARCADADQRIAQAEAKREAAQADAASATRVLEGLRAALHAITNEDAERQLQRARAVATALADKSEALRQLATLGGGLSLETLLQQAMATTQDADDCQIAEIDARQADRVAQIDTARTAANATASELEQAGHGQEAAEAAQRREAAQAMLSRTAEEALLLHATHALLREALDRQAKTADQPLLTRIGAVFRMITGGAQAGVRVEDTKDGQSMVALEQDGVTRKPLDQLSEGTCDQLYLALRIAALEEYAKTASPLPFIADDILQTFDDRRTTATLRALRDLSERVQVIVLTHHPHVGALAAGLQDGGVQVLALQE